MPRATGQIDLRKSESILDAAVEVFRERGIDAPIEEIARRAGVSKQTIYNHYGGKEELLRALFDRRRELVTEPLQSSHADEPIEERLTAYLARIIESYTGAGRSSFMRSASALAAGNASLGRLIYDAGAKPGRSRLAAFLAEESDAGRLAIDDPDAAADMLFGMAVGASLLRLMFDAPEPRRAAEAWARECARRFLRAFAP